MGKLPLVGSPICSVFTLAMKRFMNSSATLPTTMMRSVDMQIWPWCMKAPKAAAATASSRSASSQISSGALPPSSSRQGLRCLPESSPTMRPTREEPVKFTRFTAGCAISASTTAGASAAECAMKFTTPAGRPASTKASTIRRCTAGHSSEALSTTVLPQASGMAMARTPRMTGAFHGAMPTQTPAGCRSPWPSVPGMIGLGMVSPVTCVVIAAASSRMRRGERGVEMAPAADGAGFLDAQAREIAAVRAQFRGSFEQELAACIGSECRPGRESLGRGVAGRARVVGGSRCARSRPRRR